MPGPCKWQHRFRQHVSRWTVPREAILNLLSRTTKHMTAKEIYAGMTQEIIKRLSRSLQDVLDSYRNQSEGGHQSSESPVRVREGKNLEKVLFLLL